MPRENKKRGRREAEKRKRQQDEEFFAAEPKRPKIQDEDWQQDEILLNDEEPTYRDDFHDNGPPKHEFYGLLDDEEQAYFRRAAQMLELNDFTTGSNEERDAFLAGVWRECQGKELKVASSQSCSRLMEKLIQHATSDQLKSLFQSFSGHFTYLVSHRFASHCCEMLFQMVAPLVTEELLTPFQVVTTENQGNATSTESLFLATVNELRENFGYLMTDSFASHSVRILLLVLSGRPLTSQSTQSLVQSKKKESKTKTGASTTASSRAVPASFQVALDDITQNMVGDLDSSYLRVLATHPLGNPVLQLLLEIEFNTAAQSKDKSKNGLLLFLKLFPDFPAIEETESARFVRGLMFDPVGSHLLETIIKHCPGKFFKPIWTAELQPRLSGVLKNDSAIHVLARAMERLSPEDLQEVKSAVLPEVPILLDRMQFSILKTLIDRMSVRNLDPTPVFDAISDYLALKGVSKMFKLEEDKPAGMDSEQTSPADTKDSSLHKTSLFLQAMLAFESSVRKLLFDAFTNMDTDVLVQIACNSYATYVLQQSLEIGNKVYRRIVIQKLVPVAKDLALDQVGSHVLDSAWEATTDLQFLREKVAHQLAINEGEIRESYSGRFVWRSWIMDLYTRRKQSWIDKSKQADQVLEGNITRPEVISRPSAKPKTGIEAARERFTAKQNLKTKAGISQKRQYTAIV